MDPMVAKVLICLKHFSLEMIERHILVLNCVINVNVLWAVMA